MPDLHGWIDQKINTVEQAAMKDAPDAWAETALRRCAVDRKILQIHRYADYRYATHGCLGCGIDTDYGPIVDSTNDCETLLALAEGYGLTDDELAQLDRLDPPFNWPHTTT